MSDEMSDFLAPSITPDSQFQTGSQFDVTSIGNNLKAIRAVEGKWRLPTLPDGVKLDLASQPGVNQQDLTDFLLGIDSDFHDQEEPAAEPDQFTPSFMPDQTATDKFRIYAAGITQSREPEEVTTDAVKRFKWDAIQKGRLPKDTPLDSTWSPELNSIRGQMLYDDYNSRLRGDRPGAIPANKVLDQIGKWTSPSGLLAAATQLDLWWDFGAINREWSNWGQKWQKVSQAKNPLEFATSLVDAVTGPIDDIVFPAINLALLATGVGSLANAARISFLGAEVATQALETGRLMKGLYSARGLVLPSSMDAITEASWTAKRLMSHEGALGAIGRGLESWRELTPVARVKQGMQIGMRAGFLSQAEDIFPGYQGGLQVPGTGGVHQTLQDFGLHSVLATPMELALAPYNIFREGTFVGSNGLVSLAGRGLQRAGGNALGRAAVGGIVGAGVGTIAGDDSKDVLEGVGYGALSAALLPHAASVLSRSPGFVRGAVGGAALGAGVALVTDVDPVDAVAFGAVTGASLVPVNSAWAHVPNPGKWVGYATDVLSKFSYRPIADDQRVVMAFQKGMRRTLAEQPDALKRWDELFQKHNSFIKALGEWLGTDEEGASAAVSYVMIAAAIDHTARAQAKLVGGGDEAYHLYRNKLVSQLRTFDLSGDSQFTMEEVARALAIDRTASARWTKDYERILSKLTPESAMYEAAEHNKVAEATMQQLMSLENMPDPHQYERLGPWTSQAPEDKLGIIEAYLPQAMPTFGNWPLFTRQAHEVQSMVEEGVLDGAEFAKVRTPYLGPNGQPYLRDVKADVYKVNEKIMEADDELVDTILRNPAARQKLRGGRIAPLARLQPSGRFTLARHDTVTKQQLEEMALQLQDHVHAAERLQFLTANGAMKGIQQAAADLGTTFRDIPKEDLESFLRAAGYGKNTKQAMFLHDYMLRKGFGEADLAASIENQIDQTLHDSDLWAKLGLDDVRDDLSRPIRGTAGLKKRIAQMREKARYTAAEIDLDSVVNSVRETQGDARAQELLAQFDAMKRDGYKLVHGVEYMMPHDLAVNTNLFKDIGVREMNAATLGNAFGRRHPAVARMAQERRERAMIVKALADNNLGDFDPYDERITQAYRDLRSILNEIQEPLSQRLEERKLMSFTDRKLLALESTKAPLRVEDLTIRRNLVVDRLTKMGWSDEQANAIFSSIRHFRNTSFKDLGIYAFEAKMRERNELVQALKFMGGSKYSEGFITSQRLGAAAGAYAGQAYMTGGLGPDSNEDQSLGARIAGLAGGAVLGGLAAGGLGAAVRHNGWIDDAIRRAEQRPGFMLADHLVRLRDGLRFTLSPMFDVSRYTEGLMLSHTGVPLRNAAGERVSLPLNMAPTFVRKRLGEQAWQQARSEYKALAMGRGVGDLDVLDDANHWFQQIGIMGFSPQDWQVGAFAELRKQGFSAEDAFHAARETHTYGARGRSAAELSANFVFFPFSFQKKAFTHIAKWMNDDLGRSIMISDGLQAYQNLNEQYNLDEFWRDHIPALNMLNRLNLLAYGFSPGRFGGINAQLFESLGRAAILFTPVAVNIQDKKDFLELQNLMRQLLPAVNDINWMTQEVKDSRGLWSPSHQLRRGQVEDAFNEWNQYRSDLFEQLDDQGYTWADLHNKSWLADAKNQYEAKRAELGRKYPEWVKVRQQATFNTIALEMEKSDMLAAATHDPLNAPAKAVLLASFESKVQEVKTVLGYQGVKVDGPDGWTDAPPWAFDYLREQAVNMLKADPRFKGVYVKFYSHDLGPIEAKL